MLSRKSDSLGFTLIELLVVVAIIAILAAILFPVFARAREKARQSSCASNLKSAAMAVTMYVQDHNETFPPSNYALMGANYTWYAIIEPYVKTGVPSLSNQLPNQQSGIWVCPSFRSPYPDGNPASNAPNRSYMANANLMPSWDNSLSVAPTGPMVSLSAVESPAQMVMVMPGRGSTVWHNGKDSNCNAAQQGTTLLTRDRNYCVARFRHNGGSNYALADGHVKWFKGPNAWNARANCGVVWKRTGNPCEAAWFGPPLCTNVQGCT